MLSSIFLISSCDNCGRSISKRVAELALSHRIPAICTFREFAYDGGLMAYFADEAEMYRDAAVLVDKVLKGARPAELPVEQPTRFALGDQSQDRQGSGPSGSGQIACGCRRGDRIASPCRLLAQSDGSVRSL
jgi:ABC transporter substrate binding protein